MSGGSKKQTVGYWYSMGLHMGICHGPVDSVMEIRAGDRKAWAGNATASGAISINAEGLFGGKEKEGGIVGTLDVMMGEPTQAANSYLTSKQAGPQPGYRGFLGLVFRGGKIAANNPYIKPWAVRVKRILAGWDGGTAWYPAKAEVPLAVGTTTAPGGYSVGAIVTTASFGANSRTTDIFRDGAGGIGVYYDPAGINGISVGATFKRSFLDSSLAESGITTITHQAGSPGDDRFWFRTGDKNGNIIGADDNFGYCEVSANGVYKARIEPVAGSAPGWWYGEYSYTDNGGGGLLWVEAGKIWHCNRQTSAGQQLSFWSSIPSSGLFAATVNKPTTFATYSKIYCHLAHDGTYYVYSDDDNKLYRWDISTNALIEVLSVDLGGTFGMFAFAVHRGTILTLLATSPSAWALRMRSLSDGSLVGDVTGFTNPSSDCTKIIATDTMIYVKAGVKIYAIAASYSYQVGAMNPAHIIYQCLTDRQWGLGYPSSKLDLASFTAAADTFYAEGMGLCLEWNQQDAIINFVQMVVDHAGAAIGEDPRTGQFRLRAIRADYTLASLPEFSAAAGNIISLDGFDRASLTETVNEISVSYIDAATGKEGSVTVQQLANIQAQGAVVSQGRSYPGLPTIGLALRVALRDLKAAASGLARVRLTVTRAGWTLAPGDVIKFVWPEFGITAMALRIARIDYGSLTDGAIRLECIEDVFGLPANTYVNAPSIGWEEPDTTPQASPAIEAFEVPYRELIQTLGQGNAEALPADAGYLATVAARPDGIPFNYELRTKVGGGAYAQVANGDWCPTATLAADIAPLTTAVVLTNVVDLDSFEVGLAVMVGTEICRVDAINTGTSTLTLARGCCDTVPRPWPAGTRVWAYDEYASADGSEYTDGETVDAKVITLSSTGTLDEAFAPSDSVTMDSRAARPYPPGLLRFEDDLVSGQAYPGELYGELVTSWAHRDRLLQQDQLIDENDASIGPEAGTTYTVRYYQPVNTLVNTQSAISGTSATGYSFPGNGNARITVEAVRAGLGSFQLAEHTFQYYTASLNTRISVGGDTRVTVGADTRATIA